MIEAGSPTHFTEELFWRFGSGHAISLGVYCLMSLFLYEWTWQKTCQYQVHNLQMYSLYSQRAKHWKLVSAVLANWGSSENRSQHLSLLPEFLCLTVLHSTTFFYKRCQTDQEKTIYSRPKDSVPIHEIMSKRNYIDLNWFLW